jgi:mono/diheme cytochrome c family protein
MEIEMKHSAKQSVTAIAAAMALILAANAFAEDANAKRGRVYFKMVCTVCHITEAGKAIPPMTRTMDEWAAYMDADVHAASGTANPAVSYYVSKEYRESIAASNKAAQKFAKLPDAQLRADVKAFLVSGARDSDTPASCQ